MDEAIRIANFCHFGEVLKGQYHIADASGDAVVISGGPEDKIAFTRIDPEKDYLLSTNFNLAQPEKEPVDFRWQTASEKLDTLANGTVLSPDYALDLNANRIYLTYMSQYNEIAEIDMAEEFEKGQQVVEMREFLSEETAAVGDAAFQSLELRFKAAVVGVITAAAGLLLGTVYVLVRKVK